MAIDYAPDRRLRKLRLEVAWETIKDLAQYEEEKWNDPIFSKKITLERLKPIMVKVPMVSNIKPTIYRTPHQHLNSNLKIPILHSFEENKLEYEDEDEDEFAIKMMGTEMDKESLKHNLNENDITSSICHNFSLTLNPPIKPKDSGSFRTKVVKPLTIHTPPSPHMAYVHRNEMFSRNMNVNSLQCVETTSEKHVTPSGLSRDRVRIFPDGVKPPDL
uniref:MAK10-like protein n=1 Tax=Tanacetum cinerariifolium TaxID=118510 RepID=A0A699HY57_TANCI|nr:hypothetical protein [Tanacetum cinerariifolium]